MMLVKISGPLRIALVCAGTALAGCANVTVHSFPAPLQACPTEEDEGQLAALMPEGPESDALGLRFVEAAVYCRIAASRLR